MGVIPNPKMAFIFPISCILAFIFPILIKYFPKCEGKGSFLKSQIKSLIYGKYCSHSNQYTVKSLLQARESIRIITIHRDGGGPLIEAISARKVCSSNLLVEVAILRY